MRLNEVRPRRPEQSQLDGESSYATMVSMKSGLEGRNNPNPRLRRRDPERRLNEVRPRRPEQYAEPLEENIGTVMSQ